MCTTIPRDHHMVEDSSTSRITGMITDAIAAAAPCVRLRILPTEVESDSDRWNDDLDWRIHGEVRRVSALERLYGADNDGFIPPCAIRKMRKDIGINALKAYKRRRMSDRTLSGQTPKRGRSG